MIWRGVFKNSKHVLYPSYFPRTNIFVLFYIRMHGSLEQCKNKKRLHEYKPPLNYTKTWTIPAVGGRNHTVSHCISRLIYICVVQCLSSKTHWRFLLLVAPEQTVCSGLGCNDDPDPKSLTYLWKRSKLNIDPHQRPVQDIFTQVNPSDGTPTGAVSDLIPPSPSGARQQRIFLSEFQKKTKKAG